jgi:ABC-type glycerol-3-phosphate transport system permease component
VRWLRGGILLLVLLLAWGPVVFLLLASFAPGTDFNVSFSNRSVNAYTSVLGLSGVGSILLLTLTVTVATAVLTVVIATPAAYAFARYRSRASTLAANSLLLSWILPQSLIAIAYFQLVAQLNLYGKPEILVFFGLLQTVPLSVWVLRSAFTNIPTELDESAFLDGAGMTRFLTTILVPISMPSIAAVCGYSFLLAWQMYLYPLVFLSGAKTQMATVGVVNFVGEWSTNYPEMMAFSVIITVPVMVVFMLVQRYIVTGLTAGAVIG